MSNKTTYTKKDHEIAKFINELRDIAIAMGHTQQLRERIKNCVIKFLEDV